MTRNKILKYWFAYPDPRNILEDRKYAPSRIWITSIVLQYMGISVDYVDEKDGSVGHVGVYVTGPVASTLKEEHGMMTKEFRPIYMRIVVPVHVRLAKECSKQLGVYCAQP